MTQQLVAQNHLFDLSTIEKLVIKARQAGLLPSHIKTDAAGVMLVVTGQELGLGFTASVNGINIIQNKPSISPQLMLALAMKTREVEGYKIESTKAGATCTVKRKGMDPVTTSFGENEAKATGLMGKDNYIKQPEVMFRWRVIAQTLRLTFPDVISGLYTPDELGAEVAVSEEGEMIVTQPEPTLDELLVDEQTGEIPIAPLVLMERPIEFGSGPTDTVSTKNTGAIKQSTISDKQQKMLFAIWKSKKLDESAVKHFMRTNCGVGSSKELNREGFEKMLAWFKTLP